MPLSAEQRRAITKDLYCRLINHMMLTPLHKFFSTEALGQDSLDGPTKQALEIFKVIINNKVFQEGEPHELLGLWNATINGKRGALERTYQPEIYKDLKTALDNANKLMRELTVGTNSSDITLPEVLNAITQRLEDMVKLEEKMQIPASVDTLLAFMSLPPLPQSKAEALVATITSDIEKAKIGAGSELLKKLVVDVKLLLQEIKAGEMAIAEKFNLTDAQQAALDRAKAQVNTPENLAAANDALGILAAVAERVKAAEELIALKKSLVASQLNISELSAFIQKQKTEKPAQENKVAEYKNHLLVDVVEQAARDYRNKYKGQSALENTAIFVFTAITIIKTLYGMNPLHQFKPWSKSKVRDYEITSFFGFLVDPKNPNAVAADAIRHQMTAPTVDLDSLISALGRVQNSLESGAAASQSSAANASTTSSSSSSASTSQALILHTGGVASFLANLEASYNIAVNTSVLNFVRQLRGVEFLSTIQGYYGMFGGELSDKEMLVEPIVAAYYGLVSAVNRQADRVATLRKAVKDKLADENSKHPSKETKDKKKFKAEDAQLKSEQERLKQLIYLTTDLAVAAAFRSNQGESGKADVKLFQDALEALYWYELYKAYDFEKARESFFKKPERQSEYYCDLIKAKYPAFKIDDKNCSPVVVQRAPLASDDKTVTKLSEESLRQRQQDHSAKIASEKAQRLQVLIDLGISIKSKIQELLAKIRKPILEENWEQEADQAFADLQPSISEFFRDAPAFSANKKVEDLQTFIQTQFIDRWENEKSDARGRYVGGLIERFNGILDGFGHVAKTPMALETFVASGGAIAQAIELRIKIGRFKVNDNILAGYNPNRLDDFIRRQDVFLNDQVSVVDSKVKAVLATEIQTLRQAIAALADISGGALHSFASSSSVLPSPLSIKVKDRNARLFKAAKDAHTAAEKIVGEIQALIGKLEPHVAQDQPVGRIFAVSTQLLQSRWDEINNAFQRDVVKAEQTMAELREKNLKQANEQVMPSLNELCGQIENHAKAVCESNNAEIQRNFSQFNAVNDKFNKTRSEWRAKIANLEDETLDQQWAALELRYQNLGPQIERAKTAKRQYEEGAKQLTLLAKSLSEGSEDDNSDSVLNLFTARVDEFASRIASAHRDDPAPDSNTAAFAARLEAIKQFYGIFPPNISSNLEGIIRADNINTENLMEAENNAVNCAKTLVSLMRGLLENFDKRGWDQQYTDLITAFVQHYANSRNKAYLLKPRNTKIEAQEIDVLSSIAIPAMVKQLMTPSSHAASPADSTQAMLHGLNAATASDVDARRAPLSPNTDAQLRTAASAVVTSSMPPAGVDGRRTAAPVSSAVTPSVAQRAMTAQKPAVGTPVRADGAGDDVPDLDDVYLAADDATKSVVPTKLDFGALSK